MGHAEQKRRVFLNEETRIPIGRAADGSGPGDLRGGGPAHNAEVARAMLGGQPGPVRETVLLNAAAALVANDGVPEAPQLTPALANGYARAAGAVDSGAAAGLLERWVLASQRLAS